MYSPLYRYVANRKTFKQDALNSNVEFAPVVESVASAAVRKLFKLDDTSTDFFVIGVTGALLSSPALMADFTQRAIGSPYTVTNLGYSTFTPPLGATLVSDNFGVAQISRSASKWPPDFNLSLTKADASYARVAYSSTEYAVTPCTLVGSTLVINWPAFTGIRGNVLLENPNTWSTGAVLTFYVEPTEFPYEALLNEVKKTSDWLTLLEEYGLLDLFAGAQVSPQASIGVISLALVMDTLTKLPK